MRNTWGRPPANNIWSDLRALALWIFIVGIVGYLLFPDFFHNVYNQLTVPAATSTQELDEITLPASPGTSVSESESELPSTYNSIYSGDSEISDGYWAIFVLDNEFTQLALTTDNYTFILKLIDTDTKAEVKNTLLLAANGKIKKYSVSDEVYGIVSNIYRINHRSGNI